MSLFVVGTDTEVGKTVACATLLRRFGRKYQMAYWKPVATGAETDRDTKTVRDLAGGFGEVLDELYLFNPPVSPHLAARWKRKTIAVDVIQRRYREMSRRNPETTFIVEGIGGVMVPLNDGGVTVVDLVRAMRLPCLLVTRSTLGTINHTLLTIQALRRRRIPIAGVIMNGPRDKNNKDAIERFGNTQVVGEMETMSHLSPDEIVRTARRFDPRGRLKPFFTTTP